ncbi:hypothetical protein WJX74_009426 [Apatococcus lobatus]|uniref:Tyr recombinase domain-containing protein n=1 Tax=Apatococcus lobatus TaxID=904363 RepID=A0AAW1RDW8_9CHLO
MVSSMIGYRLHPSVDWSVSRNWSCEGQHLALGVSTRRPRKPAASLQAIGVVRCSCELRILACPWSKLRHVACGGCDTHLVGLGAAQLPGSPVIMLKLHVLLKTLRPRLTPESQGLLTSLQRLMDTRLVVPWGLAANSEFLAAEPFPVSLPAATGIDARRHRAVSLTQTAPELLGAEPLQGQISSLQQWLTNQIQLDRDARALAASTWRKVHTALLQFLGFIHQHCGVRCPSLTDLLRADLHATFLRHSMEKGNSFHAAKGHVYMAAKVVAWLSIQPQGGHKSLPNLIAWLTRAAMQVKDTAPIPRREVSAMQEAGTWLDAADLLAALLRGKASAELAAIRAAACGDPITYQTARDLHDAALACCIFGFIPPPRLTCLRTCTVPSFDGQCMHSECKARSRCHGNQLLGSSTDGGSMSFHFPHHKTSIGKQQARAISFQLPAELSALLELYLRVGRPSLMSSQAQPHPFLFLTKSGGSLDSNHGASQLTDIFQGYMGRLGCKQVSPGTCRHIFVVDRKANQGMPGPSNKDAAIVMGHSQKQWDLGIYDVARFSTASQLAVDSMTAWRKAHCQRNSMQGAALKGSAPGQADASGPMHIDLQEFQGALPVCSSLTQPQGLLAAPTDAQIKPDIAPSRTLASATTMPSVATRQQEGGRQGWIHNVVTRLFGFAK